MISETFFVQPRSETASCLSQESSGSATFQGSKGSKGSLPLPKHCSKGDWGGNIYLTFQKGLLRVELSQVESKIVTGLEAI